MELPNDPMMLLSVINMKLRDAYPSLDALCEDMDIDKAELVGKLAQAGFEYNPDANKFWWCDKQIFYAENGKNRKNYRIEK